ncbi:nitrite reductase, partial [Staphylococcus hyicus]
NAGKSHAKKKGFKQKPGQLGEGTVSGDYVFCPLNEQKIDLKTGEVQEPDEGCVQSDTVEVIDGDLYLCL